jgi:SpoVK/Ycf46/Vps4 family AAA+-type ATPase
LRQAVIWPLRHPEALAALGVRPARGILLTGPPGCGKTLAARALATESGMNLLHVRPPRILSQFLGEAERAVAELFATARATAPSIIFFDEFDALAPRRSGRDPTLDRIVAQLLTEFDGLTSHPGVVALAATNRPTAIDPALTRAGRFEVHLRGRAQQPGIDLDTLAAATQGCTGADLAALVEDAARGALARLIADGSSGGLSQDGFDAALDRMRAAHVARQEDFIAKLAEAAE